MCHVVGDDIAVQMLKQFDTASRAQCRSGIRVFEAQKIRVAQNPPLRIQEKCVATAGPAEAAGT